MQLPAGQQLDTNKRKNRYRWPGWPRLNAGALPHGVMVIALLDDFVNLKNLHIQYDGKNPCHRKSVGNCTYRRTLGASYNQFFKYQHDNPRL